MSSVALFSPLSSSPRSSRYASSAVELDILPDSHRHSVPQETGFGQVSQVQAVLLVRHNGMAVRNQVHQSPVHRRFSPASDIRAQAQRRLRSSRTSSYRDHRTDTPGSSHPLAREQGKGERSQPRTQRFASKAFGYATDANRRLHLPPKPVSFASYKSAFTSLAGS